MATNKNQIDFQKVSNAITVAFFGSLTWFGSITYNKLLAIEEKVEVLLISNGQYKVEIENIKEQIKSNKPKKELTYRIPAEFVLPSNNLTTKKSKKNAAI